MLLPKGITGFYGNKCVPSVNDYFVDQIGMCY
jgi:hypothetical protein